MRELDASRKEKLFEKDGLIHGEFQPVVGPYEPWYMYKCDPETDKLIGARWRCPHCGNLYHTRGSCEDHCKGRQGQYGPTCKALKRPKDEEEKSNE